MAQTKSFIQKAKGVLIGFLLILSMGGCFSGLMILLVSDMPYVGATILLIAVPALGLGWYLATKTANEHRAKRLKLAQSNPEKYILAEFKDRSTGKQVILTEHEIFYGKKEHLEFNSDPYKLLNVYVQNGRLVLDLRYWGANRYDIRKEYAYPKELEALIKNWAIKVKN
jgi:hypothetical protein